MPTSRAGASLSGSPAHAAQDVRWERMLQKWWYPVRYRLSLIGPVPWAVLIAFVLVPSFLWLLSLSPHSEGIWAAAP